MCSYKWSWLTVVELSIVYTYGQWPNRCSILTAATIGSRERFAKAANCQVNIFALKTKHVRTVDTANIGDENNNPVEICFSTIVGVSFGFPSFSQLYSSNLLTPTWPLGKNILSVDYERSISFRKCNRWKSFEIVHVCLNN